MISFYLVLRKFISLSPNDKRALRSGLHFCKALVGRKVLVVGAKGAPFAPTHKYTQLLLRFFKFSSSKI